MKFLGTSFESGRRTQFSAYMAERSENIGTHRFRVICQLLLLLGLVLSGCGGEKGSLFEDEHDLPSHWPIGLVDAQQKIEGRLAKLKSLTSESSSRGALEEREPYETELREIVEWIPEVAADTDLSEDQWLPIYELCEVMRTHLSNKDISAIEIEEDFRKLQSLLAESALHLPPADSPGQPGEFDHDESDENKVEATGQSAIDETRAESTGTGDAS